MKFDHMIGFVFGTNTSAQHCSCLLYKMYAFLPISISVGLFYGRISRRQPGSGTRFLKLRIWRLNCPEQPQEAAHSSLGFGLGLTKFKDKENRQ